MHEPEYCRPSRGWEKELHPHSHHHGPFHGFGCCPCCCRPYWVASAPLGLLRRFRTKEERIAELEAYLEALKKETQAVEEKLRCLREE